MTDLRPYRRGKRYRWFAEAFDIAVLGFVLGAAGCVVWLVLQ